MMIIPVHRLFNTGENILTLFSAAQHRVAIAEFRLLDVQSESNLASTNLKRIQEIITDEKTKRTK